MPLVEIHYELGKPRGARLRRGQLQLFVLEGAGGAVAGAALARRLQARPGEGRQTPLLAASALQARPRGPAELGGPDIT